ncbi:unnamed protein product, partial [Heterosigma akashiwo]
VWDQATSKHLGNLEKHKGPVWSLAIWREGEDVYLMSGGQDASVQFWDLTGG